MQFPVHSTGINHEMTPLVMVCAARATRVLGVAGLQQTAALT